MNRLFRGCEPGIVSVRTPRGKESSWPDPGMAGIECDHVPEARQR